MLAAQKASLENKMDEQEKKIKSFLQSVGGSGTETVALEAVKEGEEDEA